MIDYTGKNDISYTGTLEVFEVYDHRSSIRYIRIEGSWYGWDRTKGHWFPCNIEFNNMIEDKFIDITIGRC